MALSREVREEIGLKNFESQFINKYVWESSLERELVFSFVTVSDYIPVIDRNEIDDGKFWTIDEVRRNIGKGIFTPNFENEFNSLLQKLTKKTGSVNNCNLQPLQPFQPYNPILHVTRFTDFAFLLLTLYFPARLNYVNRSGGCL